jgi:D-tagatose-1,6-bisphosphate aldolase subunit GatZ/KbaZ
MVSNPEHWEKYYSVDPLTGSIQRKYSFLDRCRYYWTFPEVEKSVRKLVGNLSRISIPFSLISQFLPNQFIKVKEGQIKNHPQDLILGKITDVLQEYLFACDPQQKQPR